MKDLVNKEAKLGDYIVYFVRKDDIAVRYGRIVGFYLINDEVKMRVNAITKSYRGGYRKLGIVCLTDRANFIIVETLPVALL